MSIGRAPLSNGPRTRITFLLEVRTPYRDQLLARVVDEGDAEVSVLYCTDAEPWRDWELGGAPYRATTLPGVAGGGRSGGFNAKLNPSVWRALTDARPDAVVIGGYALPTNQIAMVWCRRNRVPFLILWESHDLDERSALRELAAWAPRTLALRGAAAVLPTSSSARRRLVHLGFPPDRMYVLPNAPDVRAIARAVDREATPSAGPPTYLYCGRLVASKDVSTLVDAFARVQREIPEARLVIAGSGPLERDLRSSVEQLGLRHVTFRGFVQPDELSEVYRAADVFVLPSRHEPFGVVLMEAMAAGLPVVVSDRVGSAPDLVDPSSGIVFPAGNVERLAAAMQLLGADPVARAEMGRVAAAAVMKWDLDYCVDTLRRAVHAATRSPEQPMSRT